MKNNKLVILALIALGGLVAFAPITRAQDAPPANPAPGEAKPGGPGGRPGMGDPMQMMKEQLNLTDDQTEKLKPIMQERRDKMQALRKDTALTQEDKMAKRKEIMDDSNAKIKPILTAEQQDKFTQMQEKMMQNRRQHPPQAPAPQQ